MNLLKNVLMLGAILGASLGSHLQAATVSWIAGDGDWSTAANWSTGALPGPADDVVIDRPGEIIVTHSSGPHSVRSLRNEESFVLSGGSLSISAAMQINGSCILSGGELTGSGDITITGTLDWSRGSMLGGGKTIIAAGATATLTGTASKGFARTIDNAGTVNYTGTFLTFGWTQPVNTTFNNLAGGVVNVTGDGDFGRHSSGIHTFNNAGTFNKSGVGTATSFTDVAFNNSGTVNFAAGTLDLESGRSSAPIDVPAGATLNFNGTFSFADGGSLSGGGTVKFNSGTHTFAGNFAVTSPITINNATLVFDAPQMLGDLILDGGTLSGSGDVTITGTLNWLRGAMSGSGRTIIPTGATATISGTGSKGFSRVLENAGTVNYSATTLSFGWLQPVSSTFNNLAGAVFNVSSEAAFSQHNAGTHVFNNAGTFNKSGANTTAIFNSVAFNNSGTVNLTAGTLDLNSGGSSSGLISVAAGATLDLDGTFTFESTGTVSGGGEVIFSSGTHTFTDNSAVTCPITIGSATVTFDSPQTLRSLSLSGGGTLSGSRDVTITGMLEWSRGFLLGSGKAIIAAGATATFSGTGPKGFTRTIENAGTVNFTGTFLTFGWSQPINTTFNNLAGATFNVTGEGSFNRHSFAIHTFNNAGTFNRSGAGTATSFIDVTFNNSGTVNFAAGILDFHSGSSSKPIDVPVGAILNFNGPFSFQGGGSLSADGPVNFNSGIHTFAGNFAAISPITINNATLAFDAPQTLRDLSLTGGGTLSGSGDVTITGALNWSRGSMSGSGRTIIAAGATATLSGTAAKGFTRTIENAGTVNYTGTSFSFGWLQPVNTTFNNLAGGVFNVTGEGDFTRHSFAIHAFNNAGTFNKSGAGTTTSFADVAFNNNGNMIVESGNLELSRGTTGFPGASVLQIDSGSTLQLSTGDLTGTTTNSDQWAVQGRVLFDGGGVHQLEVMGQDLGNDSAGFGRNFGYGTLQLANNTSVRLVDQSDNAVGNGAEALYVNSLVVPARTTLDLNGLHLYARSAQISGTVVGGTVFQIADTGVAPPSITTQPSSQIIALGGSATFSAVASGQGPLSYQWLKNGNVIPGASSPTFTLPSVQLEDGGSYTVVISNSAGNVESNPALLQIELPVIALNDRFGDRQVFTDATFAGTTDNVTATLDPSEPRHAGKPGGKSLWMTWRAPVSGVVTFTTTGSGFDTTLAVYTGSTISVLNEVASDEDRGGFLTSKLQFNAVAGTEYEIAVDGFAGATGTVVLSWDLVVNAPALPEITQQPTSVLAVMGDTVTFRVAAQPAGVTYQWLLNGQNLAAQTAPVLSFVADASRVGTYRARVRAPNGQTLESGDATLEVLDQPQPGLRLSADKLDDLFDPAEIGLASLHRVRPNAALPPSQGWVLEADLTQSTRSPDDPKPCGVITSVTRWFRVRPLVPAPGRSEVLLSTVGSDVPTVLAVFTNRNALTLVACSVDAQARNATVVFTAVKGVDYLVMVARLGESPGKVRLSYRGAEELPNFLRTFSVEAGHLQVQMLVVPGKYVWSWGSDAAAWAPMFQTNVMSGLFQYSEPLQLIAPVRLFRLVPAK